MRAGARIVMGAGLIGLSALSLTLAWSEYRSFLLSGGGTIETMSQIAEAEPPAPWSLSGQRRNLLSCERAMSFRALGLQPAPVRQSVLTRCGAVIAKARAAAPRWGLAHYLQAQHAAATGTIDLALQHLQLSQQYAPFEAWVGDRRWRLMQDLAPRATEAQQGKLRTLLTRELPLLAESRPGRDTIAATYIGTAELRAVLAASIDGLGEETKRAVLASIRRAAGSGSS